MMMCSSFLFSLYLALNIRVWLCLHYEDKINSVNTFIFIVFMMKNHTVQSVPETTSDTTFSSPLLQAA